MKHICSVPGPMRGHSARLPWAVSTGFGSHFKKTLLWPAGCEHGWWHGAIDPWEKPWFWKHGLANVQKGWSNFNSLITLEVLNWEQHANMIKQSGTTVNVSPWKQKTHLKQWTCQFSLNTHWSVSCRDAHCQTRMVGYETVTLVDPIVKTFAGLRAGRYKSRQGLRKGLPARHSDQFFLVNGETEGDRPACKQWPGVWPHV